MKISSKLQYWKFRTTILSGSRSYHILVIIFEWRILSVLLDQIIIIELKSGRNLWCCVNPSRGTCNNILFETVKIMPRIVDKTEILMNKYGKDYFKIIYFGKDWRWNQLEMGRTRAYSSMFFTEMLKHIWACFKYAWTRFKHGPVGFYNFIKVPVNDFSAGKLKTNENSLKLYYLFTVL